LLLFISILLAARSSFSIVKAERRVAVVHLRLAAQILLIIYTIVTRPNTVVSLSGLSSTYHRSDIVVRLSDIVLSDTDLISLVGYSSIYHEFHWITGRFTILF
jgi:hypothetical protein